MFAASTGSRENFAASSNIVYGGPGHQVAATESPGGDARKFIAGKRHSVVKSQTYIRSFSIISLAHFMIV